MSPVPPGAVRAPRSPARRRSAAPGLRAVSVAIALAAACGGALAQQPRVDPDGTIRYRVVPGDTLIGIGERLLEPPSRWRDLRALNRVRVPTRLAPGTELRIDPAWLRGEPSALTLESVGGGATLDGVAAAAGATGRESSRVETGPDGVVVVRLRDGTSLTIPPASAVRFERLREYLGTDSIEAAIGVERGSIETRSAPGRSRGLRIRTPAATAAVRGTDFRVRSDGDEAAIEVLAGRVEAEGLGGRADLPAGSGAIAALDRPPRVETLLPGPALDGLPARIETPAATLRFAPVDGASAYRVRVALDEGFTRLLSDAIVPRPGIAVATREDGRLFVRARPISAIGLQGLESVAVVEVAARPEPPLPTRPAERGVVFGREVAFAWTEPEGVAAYRIQVAADEAFAAPLLDAVVASPAATVELPPPAAGSTRWWWRVASIAGSGTSARQGPFSTPRPLEQRPEGTAPGGEVDDDRVFLSWTALPGHRYRVQLAGEPGFAAPLLERELDEPRTTLEGLAPGRYWARTLSVDPQGVVSPWSPAQRFEVRSLLRSGAGAPVGSGGGGPIELQHAR
jgi:hypothetical protein